MTPLPLMVRLASRAAGNPGYLAAALGPDVAATAERLGCDLAAAVGVHLCRMPACRADVRRIAEGYGVSYGLLASAWDVWCEREG